MQDTVKNNPGLTDFLKLRVPDSKKDKDWYKYHGDRIIPGYSALTVEGYEEMKKLYEFLNNDLTRFKPEIDYYCGSLEEFGATEEELVPYNPIPSKIEVLKGDMLARGNNYKVILLTAKALQRKDTELYEKILESVNAELQIAVEKQRMKMEGMSDEEIQEYVANLQQSLTPKDINVKSYTAENEILANKLLQFTFFDQDIQSKRLETLVDTAVVDRFYLYPGWKNGRPYINILNPLHFGFHKNPNSPFVQHGDYAWYRDEITVADALQEYGNRLTEDEITQLIQYGHTINAIDKRHATEPVFDYTRYYSLLTYLDERVRKGIGLHQGISLTNVNLSQTLWRVHLEFKAFKEVIFLTTTDEYGDKITFTLDSKADIIPDHASKVKFTNRWFDEDEKWVWADEEGNEYEAEIVWIPRRYELTRLGNDIYVDCREVPFQPDYGDDPWSRFELSYKGGIMNSRNAKTISMVQRALPSAFQYMSAKRIQDREMAKYVGQERIIDADQVPDELGLDHENNPEQGIDRLLKQDIIARKTGTRYFSGSRTNGTGLQLPNTRTVGVAYEVVDTSPQLIQLQQLCTLFDSEVGLRMGIPPQREAQVIPGTNVSDNRQALMQSTLQTQSLFFFIDKVWSHVLNEHLCNLRTYLKNLFAENPKLNNHQFQYVLPDGTKEVLSITPDSVEFLEDVGLYLFDSGRDQIYFQMMINNLQAFAQNQGEGVETMSAVLKSLISTNSVEETHKMIQIEADKQRQRLEQQNQMQQQLQEQMKQAQMELQKYMADLKLQNDIQKIQAQGKIALLQSEIESQRFALQADIDKNSINDDIQKEKMKLEHDSNERAKDRVLEREKLNVDREKILSKPVG